MSYIEVDPRTLRTVTVTPKQPRFISDIKVPYPDRIDEEEILELNEREIFRCMQFANVTDEDGRVLNRENYKTVKAEDEEPEEGEGDPEEPTEP
ncbi:MAG: hypothetical protein PHC62_00280 [Candidatus Izemoplasmatales bacterium]|nr:hypothetical protein [Candidatus Izemoplasmatales bacterium]